MNKTTLKALKGSIAKWQKIVDGTGIDEGTKNCPLCKMFLHREMIDDRGYIVDDMCGGCPVAIATDYSAICFGSPYGDYARTKTKRNATRMLRFLQRLVPPEAR